MADYDNLDAASDSTRRSVRSRLAMYYPPTMPKHSCKQPRNSSPLLRDRRTNSLVAYSDGSTSRGGREVQASVAKALRSIATGSSLRKAQREFDAPYSSLHKAWVELGGQQLTSTWMAFVKSVTPLAIAPSPDPEQSTSGESPLGPRLARRAGRFGDAVPYGQHGP